MVKTLFTIIHHEVLGTLRQAFLGSHRYYFLSLLSACFL